MRPFFSNLETQLILNGNQKYRLLTKPKKNLQMVHYPLPFPMLKNLSFIHYATTETMM